MAIHARHGAEQPDGVGVARVLVDLDRGSRLHDAARVHHDDALGVARDHAQVVGDDDQRDAHALGQVAHQLQDLRLDGDVERRRRLVGDDQLRLARQRQGDHHALTHAAAEVMRELLQAPLWLGDADHAEQLHRALIRRLLAEAEVQHHRLGELQPD
jgi:hypothetical protein